MTILVTGATGTVGRQIVTELAAAGRPVRALTRRPESADLPAGVEVVRGDLTAPETLDDALDGVTALHLITFGGADALSYAPLETGAEIVERARKAGVRRFTVLSVEPGTVEAAVRDSGCEWTFVSPVEFRSNTLEWAEPIRTEGVLREPFPERVSALVHEADTGAVTAEVLANGGYAGEHLMITGPEALTLRQRIAILAEAVGRDIGLVELTEHEARDKWAAEGYPAEVVDFFVSVYRDTPEEGRTVTDTVRRVTGRSARSFARWAAENADAFR